MTNETKTQDDGYQELDVSKTTDKVEYELEDGGSPDKGMAPSPASEQKEASPSKSEDSYIVEPEKSGDENKELDGIETDGARKRINKLVKQRKEKEEALYAAQEQINQLQEKLEQSHKKTKDVEATNLINYEKQIQEKLKNSEELYKSAYDSGDKDKLLEAQKNIADATTELRLVGAKRWYYEDQKKEEKPATEAKQAPQQPKAKPNPLAMEWKDNNEWFEKDQIMTQGAYVINQNLLNEGYDPDSKEFYNEISRRIQKEFPHKFGEQDNPLRPAQVVAGKSRSPAPSKGKVRLSSEDVRLAKKMGVPLDVYAKEKAKVEKAGDEYTYVNA